MIVLRLNIVSTSKLQEICRNQSKDISDKLLSRKLCKNNPGRSSDLLTSGGLPITKKATVAEITEGSSRAYSSGYCSGFSPDSLLSR
jgi:hypothetical protein